jgi:hypothetical protein
MLCWLLAVGLGTSNTVVNAELLPCAVHAPVHRDTKGVAAYLRDPCYHANI